MLNLNSTTLQQVAEKAAQDAADHPRWLTAIGRALIELDNNPWIERNAHGGLTIGSPSGECYAANGVCQCRAFEHKIPCWHRAAARLVRLHDERQQQIICQQPDNLCELHNPCPEHAAYAAAYLAQEAILNRKIAAQRATALVNELFA